MDQKRKGGRSRKRQARDGDQFPHPSTRVRVNCFRMEEMRRAQRTGSCFERLRSSYACLPAKEKIQSSLAASQSFL